MTSGGADSPVPAGGRRSWKTAILITALAAGFVAARLPLLLGAPLEIYDDEELYNGTAAKELTRGFQLSLEDYMYFPHEGGALAMTVLTVPFFLVFGPSFAALKLSALSVSLATFLIWYVLVERYISRFAAGCLALFFILAPPLLLKSDLMVWGHHNNIGLLIAVAAYLLTAELSASSSASNPWRLRGLGFVCGFGMFFAYIFLPMLLACLCLLLFRGRVFRRQFADFVIWVVVGFSPWFAVNLANNFAGLEVFGGRPGSSYDPGRLTEKAIEFFTLCLPLSPNFDPIDISPLFLLSQIYAWTLLACVVAGVPLLFRRSSSSEREENNTESDQRNVLHMAYVFCLLYVLVYIVSPFQILLQWPEPDLFFDFRYLLPLYPFAFLITAIVLDAGRKWPGTSWHAVWRYLAVLTLGGLGFYGVIHGLEIRESRPSRSYRGYSYERFGLRCFNRYAENPERTISVADNIDPAFVDDFYRGVGWGISGGWRRQGAFDRIYQAMPAEFRPYAWEGIAWRVMDNSNGDLAHTIQFGETVEPRYRPAFYRGLGWVVGKRFRGQVAKARQLLDEIPRDVREAAYFGLGRVIGERKFFTQKPPKDLALVPEKFRDSLEKGMRESKTRYDEGRFMDGLTYLRWGEVSFFDWEE